MKLSEILHQSLTDKDRFILSGIRESIDHLNNIKLYGFNKIDPDFAHASGGISRGVYGVEYESVSHFESRGRSAAGREAAAYSTLRARSACWR